MTGKQNSTVIQAKRTKGNILKKNHKANTL